jgi:hypothetical protein
MIDQYDVVNVADSINMEINEDIIAEVIYQYNSTSSDDPGATWDLIVERILYEVKSQS